jgi:hypothetical protein
VQGKITGSVAKKEMIKSRLPNPVLAKVGGLTYSTYWEYSTHFTTPSDISTTVVQVEFNVFIPSRRSLMFYACLHEISFKADMQ